MIESKKVALDRFQQQRDQISAARTQREMQNAMNSMAISMRVQVDILPENQGAVTLPVQAGSLISLPHERNPQLRRRGEILVISNVRIRYKADAIAALREMPVTEFQRRWGQDIREASDTSLRDDYLGGTPGKASPQGQIVVARYQQRTTVSGVVEVQLPAPYNRWHPLLDCDMGHSPVDAVDYWNNTGRRLGARHDTIRAWMLNPSNYRLEPSTENRSAGARSRSRYQPPLV